MGGSADGRRQVRAAYLASVMLHAVLAALVVVLLRPSPPPPRPEPEPLGFETWSSTASPASDVAQDPEPRPISQRQRRIVAPVRRGELVPVAAPLTPSPAPPAPVATLPEAAGTVTVAPPAAPPAASAVAAPAAASVGPPGRVAGAAGAGSSGARADSTEVAPEVGRRMLLAHPDPDCADDLGAARNREVQVRICVAMTGAVIGVTVLRAPSEDVAACVSRQVRSSWRYRPLTVEGRSVPFCYLAAFLFE